MKNKEIEELLNELKEVTNSKKLSSTYCITNKHWQLLLSHIEQLEKELKEEEEDSYKQSQFLVDKQKMIEQLEKRNKQLYEGFMATQEELTDYAIKNEQLEKENKKLKQWDKNKDTRNSRQRIANAILMKKNKQLEKEYKLLKDRNEINIDRNIEAYRIVEQLENNRDKAIEYVESHFIFNDKTGECYQTHTFDKDNVKKLYDILKGDSDE